MQNISPDTEKRIKEAWALGLLPLETLLPLLDEIAGRIGERSLNGLLNEVDGDHSKVSNSNVIYAPEARQAVRKFLRGRLDKSYSDVGDSSAQYDGLTFDHLKCLLAVSQMEDNEVLDGADLGGLAACGITFE